MGNDVLPPYLGYDNTVNPQLSVGFSTFAYRFGHSGMSNMANAIDSNGAETQRALADVFFDPAMFAAQADPVGAFLLGSSRTCHERLDLELNPSLRRMLFGNVMGQANMDLAALNVARGRDHNIGTFNQYRTAMGLPTTTLSQMNVRSCVADDIITSFSGNIDNVPPFAAALAEESQGNSQLGETLTEMIKEQFTRLRDGDRFFFENTANGMTLTEAERDEIRATTIKDIIVGNTFINADQLPEAGFESDMCCPSKGSAGSNMMCRRSASGSGSVVNMENVAPCLAVELAVRGEIFSPGTVDPATNVFYDCDCQADSLNANSASAVSNSLALVAASALIALLF